MTRWLDTWWMTVGAQLRRRDVEAATPAEPEPVASLAQRLRRAALQGAERSKRKTVTRSAGGRSDPAQGDA